jgi:hypothetical protein
MGVTERHEVRGKWTVMSKKITLNPIYDRGQESIALLYDIFAPLVPPMREQKVPDC